MNTLQSHPHESACDVYARRLAARLDDSTGELPHDISERLRAARVQALAQRKKAVPVHQTAPTVVQTGASAALGWLGGGSGWWRSLLGAVPAMALMVGLVVTWTHEPGFAPRSAGATPFVARAIIFHPYW